MRWDGLQLQYASRSARFDWSHVTNDLGAACIAPVLLRLSFVTSCTRSSWCHRPVAIASSWGRFFALGNICWERELCQGLFLPCLDEGPYCGGAAPPKSESRYLSPTTCRGDFIVNVVKPHQNEPNRMWASCGSSYYLLTISTAISGDRENDKKYGNSNPIHVKVLPNHLINFRCGVSSRERPGFSRVMGLPVFYSRTFLCHLLWNKYFSFLSIKGYFDNLL